MHSSSTPALPTTAASNLRKLRNAAVMAVILAPCLAMADSGPDTCTLLKLVMTVLNGASIVVVTIAIIFAGYQIAFAHKRISDVAPVFLGAIMIGAAAQIANLLLSASAGGSACQPTGSITPDTIQYFASAVKTLVHVYA